MSNSMVIIITNILISIGILVTSTEEFKTNINTLIMVHSIFRHGDRTPDIEGRYPNDPYKDEAYLPYGSGELVNQGKQRAYDLGEHLRSKYGQFLGDDHFPTIVEARSSSFNRAQMSLLFVLAALFPHKSELIPYKYDPLEQDMLFLPFMACPNFRLYMNKESQNAKTQDLNKKFAKIFEYITQNTGMNISNIMSASGLYFVLKTEEEWGFVLPSWTSKVYPDFLEYVTTVNYQVTTGSTELKQILSGTLLQKIVNDTLAKVENRINTKIFLYSGHDINLAFFLNTLNVFFPHVPPYSAHILIEVHHVRGQYGVKLYYDNYQCIESGILVLPGCEEFCPLDQFIALVKYYFPDKDVCGKNTQ